MIRTNKTGLDKIDVFMYSAIRISWAIGYEKAEMRNLLWLIVFWGGFLSTLTQVLQSQNVAVISLSAWATLVITGVAGVVLLVMMWKNKSKVQER